MGKLQVPNSLPPPPLSRQDKAFKRWKFLLSFVDIGGTMAEMSMSKTIFQMFLVDRSQIDILSRTSCSIELTILHILA